MLLRQLSTIPPEKEASDQNVIELQQLYPISPKEIKHLINTLHTDGSWEDINYADTKRSGWEPKKHTERILKLTKYHYQKKQIIKQSISGSVENLYAKIGGIIKSAFHVHSGPHSYCSNKK